LDENLLIMLVYAPKMHILRYMNDRIFPVTVLPLRRPLPFTAPPQESRGTRAAPDFLSMTSRRIYCRKTNLKVTVSIMYDGQHTLQLFQFVTQNGPNAPRLYRVAAIYFVYSRAILQGLRSGWRLSGPV